MKICCGSATVKRMGRRYFIRRVRCSGGHYLEDALRASYSPGRGGDWLKMKCVHEQEFVIGGFTLPSNGSHGVGALLLGYYDGGKLIYAGRTGTGFTQKTHGSLRDKLEELRRRRSVCELPAEARRGAIWVQPRVGGAGEICYLDCGQSGAPGGVQRNARR